MKIGYDRVIHASHELCLPYESKCNSLHGHSYQIHVEVQKKHLDENGMVVDFTKLGKVIDQLDHKHLNDIIDNPTAENVVLYLLSQISSLLTKPFKLKVRVWETENSYAEDEIEEGIK